MHRARFAVLLVSLAIPRLVAADQAVDTFRVVTAPIADVHQEALEAVSPESTRISEVFPGTYESIFAGAVMRRLETLRGRLDEADRKALVESKAGAGFDRSILKWRAQPDGRTVALAVRYYREPLFHLELEATDDYGRAEPVEPERFEFFAVALCSRAETGAWTCREDSLSDLVTRHTLKPPQRRQERIAAAEQLVDIVLASK